jgi:uncharacterized protein YigE (DUF2233 family)
MMLLLVAMMASSGTSGAAEALTVGHRGQTFDVYRLASGEEQRLRFFWKGDDGTPYGSIAALETALGERGEQLLFALNGGIYSKAFEPLGLYIERGKIYRELNGDEGGGNFFLKPNGVFYITEAGAAVVTTEAYAPQRQVINAVQSGPMLVSKGRLHPRFIPGYHSKHVRNGVGVDAQGRVVFAMSSNPVNFHDFGTLFRDRLQCPDALYLDGKIAALYAPALKRFATWSWRPFVTLIGMTVPLPPGGDGR